ncbi:MAG: hypothetical protein AB7R69_00735 [Candidatus Babeliales bacterium]
MKKNIVILSTASLLIGALLYVYLNNLIIFRSPFNTDYSFDRTAITKKKVTLFFWRTHQWHHEEIELLWSEDMSQTVHYLVNAWFSLMHEEKVIPKKITVQTVAVAHDNLALISLDHNPFEKQYALYEKWMLMEGLLKTIRTSTIPIKKIVILTHEQLLHDYHIDLETPWPIEGFLKEGE